MTPEENRRREQDEHVKYIKEHLCDKDAKKPFVFISYKSDDWEMVLHDIVYSLVKDHGLNVYFDGSFDSHNSLWINQFPENMEDDNCKGVLVFLDNKYATSYATLLELMYSQTYLADSTNGGLPVVPINLDKLTVISGEEGSKHTGLGLDHYEDGTKNLNAKTEEELFDETFEQLKDRDILKKSKYLYKKNKKLTKKICSEIVAELVAYLSINENYYEEGKSLDGLVKSIKDACGKDVFGKGFSEPISALQQDDRKPLDWSQFADVKSFQYKDKVYNVFSKEDAYAKLCELLCDDGPDVFIMEIGNSGEEYIELKNGKKAALDFGNPIGVFKKYKDDIVLYAEQQPDAETVPKYERKIFEKPVESTSVKSKELVIPRDIRTLPGEYTMSLIDLYKVLKGCSDRIKSNPNYKKFELRFENFELIGSGEGENYSNSVKTLKELYIGLIAAIVKNQGEDYLIRNFDPTKNTKDQTFIDSKWYENLEKGSNGKGRYSEIPGYEGEWYVYSQWRSYNYVRETRKRLDEIGLSEEDFEICVVLDVKNSEPYFVELFNEIYETRKTGGNNASHDKKFFAESATVTLEDIKDIPEKYYLPIADMAKVMEKAQKKRQDKNKNTATKIQFKLKYKECELIGLGADAAAYSMKTMTEDAVTELYVNMVKKIVDNYGEDYLAMFKDNDQKTGLIRARKDGSIHKPISGWDGWYYYSNTSQKECLTFILKHLEKAGTNLTADDFEVRVVLDKDKTEPICVKEFYDTYNEVTQK